MSGSTSLSASSSSETNSYTLRLNGYVSFNRVVHLQGVELTSWTSKEPAHTALRRSSRQACWDAPIQCAPREDRWLS